MFSLAADEFASLFLLENSADVNLASERSGGDTALHMAARGAIQWQQTF